MSRRMWVGLAIAALVAAVLTIPAAGQGAPPNNTVFGASVPGVNVVCAYPANGTVSIMATASSSGTGGYTGPGVASIAVSWATGVETQTGSLTALDSGLPLTGQVACPATYGGTTSGTVSFQPKKTNGSNTGTATSTGVTYTRVCGPSGSPDPCP